MRHHDGQQASEEAEQQAFHNHLRDQAGTAGAQGFADGELALPRRSARQHQVGQIGARQQQDQSDRGQQDHQIAPQFFAHVLHVNREDIGAKSGIQRRVLLFQPLADDVHLLARLVQRNAGTQPREHLHLEPVQFGFVTLRQAARKESRCRACVAPNLRVSREGESSPEARLSTM